MYIAVSLNSMTVLYKSESIELIDGLCLLEVPNDYVSIFPLLDATPFQDFTNDDLLTLGESLSTEKFTLKNVTRRNLIQLIYVMCDKLKPTNAIEFEVFSQINNMKDETTGYLYQKGRKRPKIMEKEWTPPPLCCNISLLEIKSSIEGGCPDLVRNYDGNKFKKNVSKTAKGAIIKSSSYEVKGDRKYKAPWEK